MRRTSSDKKKWFELCALQLNKKNVDWRDLSDLSKVQPVFCHLEIVKMLNIHHVCKSVTKFQPTQFRHEICLSKSVRTLGMTLSRIS